MKTKPQKKTVRRVKAWAVFFEDWPWDCTFALNRTDGGELLRKAKLDEGVKSGEIDKDSLWLASIDITLSPRTKPTKKNQ